jgi:hypothetical protein
MGKTEGSLYRMGSMGVNLSGFEADHSPTSTDVRKRRSVLPTPHTSSLRSAELFKRDTTLPLHHPLTPPGVMDLDSWWMF